MKQGKKRRLAFMLALSMVFSLFTGLSVHAEGEDEGDQQALNGFCIAGVDWNDGVPQYANDDWFMKGWEPYICTTDNISLGIITGGEVAKVTDINKIQIKQIAGNEEVDIEEGTAFISNMEDGEDLSEGTYILRFNALGDFRIIYDDENIENNTVDVHVSYPDVAIYSANAMSVDNLVCVPWEEFEYESGKDYYLIAAGFVKDDENLVSAEIQFNEDLGLENIDWKSKDFAPQKFTIPDNVVKNYNMEDFVNVLFQYNVFNEETEENETREDMRPFKGNSPSKGLVVADTLWNQDPETNEWRDYAVDPTANGLDEDGNKFPYSDWFEKSRDIAIYYTNNVTLGIGTDEGIEVLDKNSIDKLSIVNKDGSAVSDDVAVIGMCSYDYWDDAEQKHKNVNVDDVFTIYIYKSGSYFIKYTDGDNSSIVALEAGMPDIAIYGKKAASEKYILGGDNTQYNDGRKTFYILPHDFGDDWHTEETAFTGAAKGNSSDVKVTTDLENNIITVNVAEDATDDICVRVAYKNTQRWYHFDYETNERVEDTDDDGNSTANVREDERDFWFNPAEEVRAYSEEGQADVKAVEDAEKLIAALPDSRDIAVDDEEAVTVAREAYEALDDELKAIVDETDVKKLEAAESAVEAAKEAAEAAEKKAADEAKKVEEDKTAAVQAAKDEAEAAAKTAAAEAKKAAEAEKTAAVAEAKKAAEVEKTAAVAEAKKAAEAEKTAAVDAAVKAAEATAAAKLPKAGASIYDETSQAVYKVLTASDGKTVGAVEYKQADSMVKKMVVPETITVDGITYEVTSIGASAFEGNTKVTSVTVPVKVSNIGKNAFYGCKKLKTITIKSTVLKTVGKNALKGINKKATIKVPKAQLKDYKKLLKKKGQGSKVKIK